MAPLRQRGPCAKRKWPWPETKRALAGRFSVVQSAIKIIERKFWGQLVRSAAHGSLAGADRAAALHDVAQGGTTGCDWASMAHSVVRQAQSAHRDLRGGSSGTHLGVCARYGARDKPHRVGAAVLTGAWVRCKLASALTAPVRAPDLAPHNRSDRDCHPVLFHRERAS